MAKHKHYDCIVAWSEGKQIQGKCGPDTWVDLVEPVWNSGGVFRVKPEPKPDQVIFGRVELSGHSIELMNCFIPRKCRIDNLSLTFDGETGKLKSAEVIPSEDNT